MTSSSSFNSNSNLNRETDQDYVGLKKRIDELTLESKKVKEIKACFLKVSYKWKLWYDSEYYKANCVRNENPYNTFIKHYSYIEITNNTNVKYNCEHNNRDTKVANLYAENYLKRPILSKSCLNCSNYIFNYYEIKLIIERSRPFIEIGFWYIYLRVSGSYIFYYDDIVKNKFINLSSSFSFNNEDIIGCGVVYPNINNKLPYIFFTKNGELIGKAIQVKGRYNLNPFVRLKFCSIETNFGDDLNSKPFKYDITNHIVTEEFYEEEDFTDE